MCNAKRKYIRRAIKLGSFALFTHLQFLILVSYSDSVYMNRTRKL
jgi:hypothetical protein